MASTLDLKQLAVDRTAPQKGRTRSRRHLFTRYVVPLFVLLGFAAVIGWAARESFLPAKSVTVVPVIVAKAEVQQSGTPLFQAAGWIEPRPTPIVVSALAEGVVEELLVVEGQEVEAGEPVAKLIEADTTIQLRQAEADLRLRQAELAQAKAALTGARINFEQPLELEAALAEANSLLARARTELHNLPFTLRTAQSRLELAQQELEGKKGAGDAISGRMIQRAQSEFDSAQATVEETASRKSGLEEEVKSLQARKNALTRRLELKTNEQQKLAEAEASVEAAEAKVQQAKLAVQTSQLRLSRMTIKAPMSGRVLTVNARPGTRLMGLDPTSELDATTVLTMYDPRMLQVRADVRLEDVPSVTLGAPVQIETAAAGQQLEGEVISVTSSADIQKNTLQVKVAIKSPPPVIKPEMLAQVTFLAPELPESSSEGEEPLRTLVPRDLVVVEGDSHFVWIADRNVGVARKRSVRLGKAGTEQLVEIVEGVSAMDKLIGGGREGLEDGDRIRITGDDSSMLSQASNTSVATNDTRLSR